MQTEHLLNNFSSIFCVANTILLLFPNRNTINRKQGLKNPVKKVARYDYDIPRTSSEVKKNCTDLAAKSQKNGDVVMNHHSNNKLGGIMKIKQSSKIPSGQSKSLDDDTSLTSSSVTFIDSTEHVYEPQAYETTDMGMDKKALSTSVDINDASIYENTKFFNEEKEVLNRKTSLPQFMQDLQQKASPEKKAVSRHKSMPGLLKSKKKHNQMTHEYEDPDRMLDESEDCYMDMDRAENLHDMYVDPDDLRKRSGYAVNTISDSVISTQPQRKIILIFFI